jgi:hypothetical protein
LLYVDATARRSGFVTLGPLDWGWGFRLLPQNTHVGVTLSKQDSSLPAAVASDVGAGMNVCNE